MLLYQVTLMYITIGFSRGIATVDPWPYLSWEITFVLMMLDVPVALWVVLHSKSKKLDFIHYYRGQIQCIGQSLDTPHMESEATTLTVSQAYKKFFRLEVQTWNYAPDWKCNGVSTKIWPNGDFQIDLRSSLYHQPFRKVFQKSN